MMMKTIRWQQIKDFFTRPRGAVRCDVCGKWAYPLKWGGLLHVSFMGTTSVHAIHYLRHMFGAAKVVARSDA